MFGSGGGAGKGMNKLENRGPSVEVLNLFEWCQSCALTTETVDQKCSRCGMERLPDAESRRRKTDMLVKMARRG